MPIDIKLPEYKGDKYSGEIKSEPLIPTAPALFSPIDLAEYQRYVENPVLTGNLALDVDSLTETRASNQPWSHRAANSLIKFGGKSVVNFGGAMVALPALVGKLFGSEYIDNELFKGIDSANEWLDESFPHYLTKAQQDYNTWQKITKGDSGFWGNDFLGGMSFLVGTVMAEAVLTLATTTTFGGALPLQAAHLARVAKMLNKLRKPLAGATNKAIKAGFDSTRLASDIVGGIQRQSALNTLGRVGRLGLTTATSTMYESALEARGYKEHALTALKEQFRSQNFRDPNDLELTELVDAVDKGANAVFALNAVTVGLSNAILLDRLIGGPIGKITDDIKLKKLKKDIQEIDGVFSPKPKSKYRRVLDGVSTAILGAGREGLEEGLQKAYDVGVNEYLLSEYNLDALDNTGIMSKIMNEGMSKAFGTQEGLEEVLIGSLLGLIGVPGMIKGSAAEAIAKVRGKDDYALFLNKLAQDLTNNKDTGMHNNLKTALRMSAINNQRELSVQDIFDFKNEDARLTYAYMNSRAKAGILEEDIANQKEAINAMSDTEFKEKYGDTLPVKEAKEKINKVLDASVESFNKSLSLARNYVGADILAREDAVDAISMLAFQTFDLDAREESISQNLTKYGQDVTAKIAGVLNKIRGATGGNTTALNNLLRKIKVVDNKIQDVQDRIAQVDAEMSNYKEVPVNLQNKKDKLLKELSGYNTEKNNINEEKLEAYREVIENNKELDKEIRSNSISVEDYERNFDEYISQFDKALDLEESLSKAIKDSKEAYNHDKLMMELADLGRIAKKRESLLAAYDYLITPQGQQRFLETNNKFKEALAEKAKYDLIYQSRLDKLANDNELYQQEDFNTAVRKLDAVLTDMYEKSLTPDKKGDVLTIYKVGDRRIGVLRYEDGHHAMYEVDDNSLIIDSDIKISNLESRLTSSPIDYIKLVNNAWKEGSYTKEKMAYVAQTLGIDYTDDSITVDDEIISIEDTDRISKVFNKVAESKMFDFTPNDLLDVVNQVTGESYDSIEKIEEHTNLITAEQQRIINKKNNDFEIIKGLLFNKYTKANLPNAIANLTAETELEAEVSQSNITSTMSTYQSDYLVKLGRLIDKREQPPAEGGLPGQTATQPVSELPPTTTEEVTGQEQTTVETQPALEGGLATGEEVKQKESTLEGSMLQETVTPIEQQKADIETLFSISTQSIIDNKADILANPNKYESTQKVGNITTEQTVDVSDSGSITVMQFVKSNDKSIYFSNRIYLSSKGEVSSRVSRGGGIGSFKDKSGVVNNESKEKMLKLAETVKNYFPEIFSKIEEYAKNYKGFVIETGKFRETTKKAEFIEAFDSFLYDKDLLSDADFVRITLHNAELAALEQKGTQKDKEESAQVTDIEAKKADIEKRRQEELDKAYEVEGIGLVKPFEATGNGVEKIDKRGTEYNEGDRVLADFVTTPQGYEEGNVGVIVRQRKPQINTDGVMTQAAEVEVMYFSSLEEGQRYIAENPVKVNPKRIERINAKYDAELAALESTTEQQPAEDINPATIIDPTGTQIIDKERPPTSINSSNPLVEFKDASLTGYLDDQKTAASAAINDALTTGEFEFTFEVEEINGQKTNNYSDYRLTIGTHRNDKTYFVHLKLNGVRIGRILDGNRFQTKDGRTLDFNNVEDALAYNKDLTNEELEELRDLQVRLNRLNDLAISGRGDANQILEQAGFYPITPDSLKLYSLLHDASVSKVRELKQKLGDQLDLFNNYPIEEYGIQLKGKMSIPLVDTNSGMLIGTFEVVDGNIEFNTSNRTEKTKELEKKSSITDILNKRKNSTTTNRAIIIKDARGLTSVNVLAPRFSKDRLSTLSRNIESRLQSTTAKGELGINKKDVNVAFQGSTGTARLIFANEQVEANILKDVADTFIMYNKNELEINVSRVTYLDNNKKVTYNPLRFRVKFDKEFILVTPTGEIPLGKRFGLQATLNLINNNIQQNQQVYNNVLNSGAKIDKEIATDTNLSVSRVGSVELVDKNVSDYIPLMIPNNKADKIKGMPVTSYFTLESAINIVDNGGVQFEEAKTEVKEEVKEEVEDVVETEDVAEEPSLTKEEYFRQIKRAEGDIGYNTRNLPHWIDEYKREIKETDKTIDKIEKYSTTYKNQEGTEYIEIRTHRDGTRTFGTGFDFSPSGYLIIDKVIELDKDYNFEANPEKYLDPNYVNIDNIQKGKVIINKSLADKIAELTAEKNAIIKKAEQRLKALKDKYGDIYEPKESPDVQGTATETSSGTSAADILLSNQPAEFDIASELGVDLQSLIKDGLVKYTDEQGTECAKAGLTNSSNLGSKWTLVKDLKNMPTHEQGGVDLKFEGGVLVNGIKAEDGLVIDPPTQRDSVSFMADKILAYEQLKGGPGGRPLPSYADPKYKKMLVDDIYPEVKKIMPNASAMELSEAMDFIFNAGWDKQNKTITKDPRGYALQEYYKKYDPSKLENGKWPGRKNPAYSFDKEYANTIGKLSENERRILMNKGRDWYYQNINNPSPGVPSPDYYATWHDRIWNTNEFTKFDPNHPMFYANKKK